MLTAIELGMRELTAVTAKVNGGGLEIVQSTTAEIGPGGLRAAFERCGAAAGSKAVLVIPRGQALLRDLEVPEGSPEELVAMVRFQVEREMPLPADQIRYSYIETGRADGKIRVQVAAVPRELLDPALREAEAAGVRITGVYLSSYGLLALHSDGGPAAVVAVSGEEAEILIVDGGRMEFSRTAPLPDGPEPKAVAEEIERTIRAWSTRSPGKELGKVVLAGSGAEAEELARALGGQLSREVVPVGPGGLDTAPAAGVCAALSRSTAMPDVLHPPAAVKRIRLTRAHRIGALVGVIAVMLIVWSQVSLADKRGQLADKRAKLKKLEPRVKQLTELEAQTALAQRWHRDRNAWVPTLEALRKNVKTSDLWITSASFEDRGVIRLQGRTKDDKHVHALVVALKKDGLFAEVDTERIVHNQDSGSYRKDFTIRATLRDVPAPARSAR